MTFSSYLLLGIVVFHSVYGTEKHLSEKHIYIFFKLSAEAHTSTGVVQVA